MHLSVASAALLGISAVSAFQDSSPFIFFSTSELLFSSPQITTSSQLTGAIRKEIAKCPSNVYVLVHQAGVSSEDFTADGATPHLKEWVSGKDKDIRSSFSVPEVAGDVELNPLQKTLEQECGAGALHVDTSMGLFDIADDSKPRVIRVDFSAPPQGEGRRASLRENDLFLSNLLETIPTSKYTVLYTTSPSLPGESHHMEEETSYEMDYASSFPGMELKRDLGAGKRQSNGSDKIVLRDGGLFERYQFFTPALFMGLIVMAFLLSIGFVAVNAIGSLQVTYGAFEKDFAKQQQQHQQKQQ